MIIKVGPLEGYGSGGGGSPEVLSAEYTLHLEPGETVAVPESPASMISVILDMDAAMGDNQILLPAAKKGRRVCFFFTHTATQFAFTSQESGASVYNGALSVDRSNLIVFYCVSESQKIWARDADM